MGSKVSLVFAFVALCVSGRALVARMRTPPASCAGLGGLRSTSGWLGPLKLISLAAFLVGLVDMVNGLGCFRGTPENDLLLSDGFSLTA